MTPQFVLAIVSALLCLAAGYVGAEEEELIWPVEPELMAKDWVIDTPDAWVKVGDVHIKNDKDNLYIKISPHNDYQIYKGGIHIVQDPADLDSVLGKDNQPRPNLFDRKLNFLKDPGYPVESHEETVPLEEFEICWGVNPEKCPPNLYIIVQASLMDKVTGEELPEKAYAENGGVFDRLDKDDDIIWGWYVTYPLAKVEAGHFIDANVNGLAYATPTQSGVTGEEGQFWFIPDERIDFSVGSVDLGDALGDRRVSPVDLFEGSDMDDNRVINVAWLLQSLDGDGNPAQGAINITEASVACLESALATFPEMPPVDFADTGAVGALIAATQDGCEENLAGLTRMEAWENLKNGQKAGNLMKKNVSKTPEMASAKAKIEIMPVYVPALTSDGYPTGVVYHDADGNVIETRNIAKPIVVSYLDEVDGTGASDVGRVPGRLARRRRDLEAPQPLQDRRQVVQGRLPGRFQEAHAQGQGQQDLRRLDRQVLPRRAAGLRHHRLPRH
jgi:hypothetical protein